MPEGENVIGNTSLILYVNLIVPLIVELNEETSILLWES